MTVMYVAVQLSNSLVYLTMSDLHIAANNLVSFPIPLPPKNVGESGVGNETTNNPGRAALHYVKEVIAVFWTVIYRSCIVDTLRP